MASTLIVDQLQKTGGSTTALTLPTSNASASQYLQNDGAGALSWATVASAGFHQMVVRSVTGSATYSPAAGVTKLIVAVQGAGGGGAGGSGSYYGSGGSAGGYALKYFTGVASTDVMTVVVGAGGGGGTGVANGVDGGASQFVSVSGGLHPFTTVEGLGGGKGRTGAEPDAAGVASGGDINIDGVRGGADTGGAYQGADSMFGFGGSRYGTTSSAARASTGYGSGGTGAYSIASGAGGAGRNGVVIIWEYK